MTIRKRKEVEISVEEKNKEKQQKAPIELLNDPEFKKAMIKASSDSDIENEITDKYTLLKDLSDREKADYFTEYKDKNEIEQVNRLQTWARLFPVVFGDSETVKLCQTVVMEHVKDNMVNRASLRRKRESALVYAVKQDSGLVQADKQIASFLGGKNR